MAYGNPHNDDKKKGFSKIKSKKKQSDERGDDVRSAWDKIFGGMIGKTQKATAAHEKRMREAGD